MAKKLNKDANTGATLQQLAGQINQVVVHLNRQLRRTDLSLGLPTAQASALALLVSAGPDTISRLAMFEHVTAPTMTRIVSSLEDRGLVVRVRQANDMRVVRVEATASGVKLIQSALAHRIQGLLADLAELSVPELESLRAGVEVLARLVDSTQDPNVDSRPDDANSG